MRNWSETITYSSTGLAHPASVDELSDIVAGHRRVRALGSRHSFNHGADTDGLHVTLDRLPAGIDVRDGQVTSAAGVTHAELSLELAAHGLALANLASLPHISVAGAIQTGTHGSGLRNPALSAGVTSIGIVDALGEQHSVAADHPDFDAVVVGLGAYGVVHSVTQRVVPAFDVAQTVYEGLPWDQLVAHLPEILTAAYSVSIFTRYDSDAVPQIWLKNRVADLARVDLEALGATSATRVLHPLPDTPSDNVTDQLGRPGPSLERLPHFRTDFQPGRGDEIQSEYLAPVEAAGEAVAALRDIGHLVGPLLHMAEIRAVASDTAWMSPAYERDSVALHFTWQRRPEEVHRVLPAVEAALEPFGARPHWGKQFHLTHDHLVEVQPRLLDFRDAVERWDPDRKFDNHFLSEILGRTEPTP